jgi:hypothetical protein
LTVKIYGSVVRFGAVDRRQITGALKRKCVRQRRKQCP